MASSPIDWQAMGEQYALRRELTLEDIAKATGRTLSTVKTHARRKGWSKKRMAAVAERRDIWTKRVAAELQDFRLEKTSTVIELSRLAMKRLKTELETNDRQQIDAHQVVALLKHLDDSEVDRALVEAIPQLVMSELPAAAVEQIKQAQAEAFAKALSESKSSGTPTSTQTPSLEQRNGHAPTPSFLRRPGS